MENEEQPEQSVEVIEGITQSTDHEHCYEEGAKNMPLKDAVCSCGHGLSIPIGTEVKEGKILWN